VLRCNCSPPVAEDRLPAQKEHDDDDDEDEEQGASTDVHDVLLPGVP
jgi:hypothetical protein